MSDNELINFRNQIDLVDKQLIAVLLNRFEITKQVGIHKKINNLPAVDPKRETEKIKRMRKEATKCGLNPQLIEDILRLIMKESVNNHRLIAKNID